MDVGSLRLAMRCRGLCGRWCECGCYLDRDVDVLRVVRPCRGMLCLYCAVLYRVVFRRVAGMWNERLCIDMFGAGVRVVRCDRSSQEGVVESTHKLQKCRKSKTLTSAKATGENCLDDTVPTAI